MLKTIEDSGNAATIILTDLEEAIQSLVCGPLNVITRAACNARLPGIEVTFVIPFRPGYKKKPWMWRSAGYESLLCLSTGMCLHSGIGGHGHLERKDDYVVLGTAFAGEFALWSPGGITTLATERSDIFYQEMLDALVIGVNLLGKQALAAIQEKNERDINLRCRVKGTQTVNQDLLDAIDRDGILSV